MPLLLAYEILAFALTHDSYAGVRNGADVLLKSAFVWLGGRNGVLWFGGVLLGAGGILVVRDFRRAGSVIPRYYLGMAGESVAYALAFGWVTSLLASALLRVAPLAAGMPGAFDLPTQLMISLGAGIYEELLFRVILVSALAALGKHVLKLGPLPSGILEAGIHGHQPHRNRNLGHDGTFSSRAGTSVYSTSSGSSYAELPAQK